MNSSQLSLGTSLISSCLLSFCSKSPHAIKRHNSFQKVDSSKERRQRHGSQWMLSIYQKGYALLQVLHDIHLHQGRTEENSKVCIYHQPVPHILRLPNLEIQYLSRDCSFFLVLSRRVNSFPNFEISTHAERRQSSPPSCLP
jgi:hypothetical protein